MKDRIGIIGHVDHGFTTSAAMALHLANKVDSALIVETIDEEAKQLPFPQSEPFILNNPYAMQYIGERDFICKGKHQYREVKETNGNLIKHSWVCQCGRKL